MLLEIVDRERRTLTGAATSATREPRFPRRGIADAREEDHASSWSLSRG
jgi:hypothetical protein